MTLFYLMIDLETFNRIKKRKLKLFLNDIINKLTFLIVLTDIGYLEAFLNQKVKVYSSIYNFKICKQLVLQLQNFSVIYNYLVF